MFLDKTFHDEGFANCHGDYRENYTLVPFFFITYAQEWTEVLVLALFPQ